MDYDLCLVVEWNSETNEYIYNTNIKQEKIDEIIIDTLRLYSKKNFSNIKPEEDYNITKFRIEIYVDLSYDKFMLNTNGSEGITFGILSSFLKTLK